MVSCPVREHADTMADALALDAGGKRLTWAELDDRIGRSMAALRREGVRQGTRVGILLRDDPACVPWLLALFRLRAVACPITARLPMPVVGEALERTGAGLLVADRDTGLAIRTLEPARAAEVGLAGGSDAAEAEWHLDLPATIIFTSGSMGRPRAALHTLGNHYWSALGSAVNIPLLPGDRWLLPLALAHVGGLAVVIRCVLAGAAVVFPAAGEPLHRAVDRLRATHVSMVPTQLFRALESGWGGSPALRALLLGGAAAPEALLQRGLAARLPLHTSYGLTEMASQVTTTGPGAALDELGTSGRPLPYRELRISESGEILVRGPTRFAGYVDGGACETPFDEDGWYATGDTGRFDEDGRLRVIGRRDNRFVSGGENIQPEAIEEALLRVRGVRRAVVVPVSDAEFGERPIAFVDGSATLEELRAAVVEHLPRFCMPRAFYPWPDDAPEGVKTTRAFFLGRAREAGHPEG